MQNFHTLIQQAGLSNVHIEHFCLNLEYSSESQLDAYPGNTEDSLIFILTDKVYSHLFIHPEVALYIILQKVINLFYLSSCNFSKELGQCTYLKEAPLKQLDFFHIKNVKHKDLMAVVIFRNEIINIKQKYCLPSKEIHVYSALILPYVGAQRIQGDKPLREP